MKCICLLFVIIAVVWAEDKYSSENDDLDIEALVKNEDALKAFYTCFMDFSECDAVAADFKKDLGEAIQTACSKCTDSQKHIFKRFLEGLDEKLPKESAEFKKKFDPENKYFTPLTAAIANS